MTAHHVLAVLEDDERRLWSVLERAIALSDAEQARLTLAKTTDPGWLMRWFAPAALQAMGVCAEELDLRTTASHKVARAAEFVPAWIPVTTLVLGQNTRSALIDLLRRGPYDALVATGCLLGQGRRLRCELDRLGVSAVVVGHQSPAPVSEPAFSPGRARFGARA